MLQKTPEEEALDAALKSLIDEEMYNLQAKIINHKNFLFRNTYLNSQWHQVVNLVRHL